MTFSELSISPEILEAVEVLGFDTPSTIQERAIPVAIQGDDIVGLSHTGSGKTLAFSIPALQNIDPAVRGVQVLCLAPTRELAVQICREVDKLALFIDGVSAVPIYGGTSFGPQLSALKRGVQFVVGTPGRVADLIAQKELRTDNINTFVLDEADEMLDMGFQDDIDRIIASLPEKHQTLFFSATMSPNIRSLIKKLSANPTEIIIERPAMTVPTCEQSVYEVVFSSRIEVLSRLIETGSIKRGLVFSNTKRVVDDIVDGLLSRGYTVDRLHGDMPQNLRERVMDSYRKGNLNILVATDIAARGLDVNDVDAVVNFELPRDPEDYVHRIGRTARAGRSGRAITFIGRRDFSLLSRIERFIGVKMNREQIMTAHEVELSRRSGLVTEIVEKAAKLKLEAEEALAAETAQARRAAIAAVEAEKAAKAAEIVDMLDEDGNIIEAIVESTDCDETVCEEVAIEAPVIELEPIDFFPTELLDVDLPQDQLINAMFQILSGKASKEIQSIPEDRPSKYAKGRSNDGSEQPEKGADWNSISNSVTLFMNCGKMIGIRPKDIAGLLYNEGGAPKGSIGDIRLFLKHTLIEVTPEIAPQLIEKLATCQVCGYEINVREDKGHPEGGKFGGEGGGQGGSSSYGGRGGDRGGDRGGFGGGGGGGERRSFGGGGGGGERRSFGGGGGGGGYGGGRGR